MRAIWLKKLPKKEEEWGKCSIAEARATDTMIFINFERDWIDDLEYNLADHLEKQETNIVDINQKKFGMFQVVIWYPLLKK